jgi:O-antigen biosynthesis protein
MTHKRMVQKVSVVMSTADRPQDLHECLEALLNQTISIPYEIIVVDNHPTSGLTPPIAARFPEVCFLQDTRGGGISSGRNTGILAATGDVIVLTNDSTRPPSEWLGQLIAHFERPEVACVVGNIAPVCEDDPVTQLVMQHTPLSRTTPYAEYDATWFHQYRTRSPRTDKLAAGANIAVRADVFSDPSVGLLDEAFGTGMPIPTADDQLLYYRLLRCGYTIVFDPAIITYHKHVTDRHVFYKRVFNYAKSVTAYEIHILLVEQDWRALGSLARIPLWDVTQLAKGLLISLRGRSMQPLKIEWLKVQGHVSGLGDYFAARAKAERLTQDQPRWKGARQAAILVSTGVYAWLTGDVASVHWGMETATVMD